MLNTDYKKRIYARDALMDPWFKNASKVAINKEFMIDALSNLKNFSATQKLQQATLSLMV